MNARWTIHVQDSVDIDLIYSRFFSACDLLPKAGCRQSLFSTNCFGKKGGQIAARLFGIQSEPVHNRRWPETITGDGQR